MPRVLATKQLTFRYIPLWQKWLKGVDFTRKMNKCVKDEIQRPNSNLSYSQPGPTIWSLCWETFRLSLSCIHSKKNDLNPRKGFHISDPNVTWIYIFLSALSEECLHLDQIQNGYTTSFRAGFKKGNLLQTWSQLYVPWKYGQMLVLTDH